MTFLTDVQELKTGLIIFRRADVEHQNWYCRVRVPSEHNNRYKTISLKTPNEREAKDKAFDHDADKRIGFVTTGTISFKTAVRLRKLEKDCKTFADNAEESFKLAKKVEKTADPEGTMIHHGKDAHAKSGNQPHVQTEGKKGHTFYDFASAFAATTYLGHGFLGEAVDFFNPLSIPKDLADLYEEFGGDDEGGENCGCMVQ